jgi:hypothetical protein
MVKEQVADDVIKEVDEDEEEKEDLEVIKDADNEIPNPYSDR